MGTEFDRDMNDLWASVTMAGQQRAALLQIELATHTILVIVFGCWLAQTYHLSRTRQHRTASR